MANGYNDMVKFVKIMKNFTVIRAVTAVRIENEATQASDVEEI
jgi:hypothetical protein